jgi:signal peptidase I
MFPRPRPLSRLPQRWRKVVDWLVTIAIAVVVVLTFETEVAQPYRVPSSSMEHTLNCAHGPGCLGSADDRILALKLEYDFTQPERGQIVVFKAPATASSCAAGDGGSTFVKRLIGMPGETVHEDKHGNIWIREPGARGFFELKEPYVQAQRRAADVTHFNKTWRVPKGEYFFMGDNRAGSCDSRDWGSVPRASLIGPVVLTYWPLDRIGFP